MLQLAWANLTHRKVRSALSVLAVAIAITLLLVLLGLSNGTLNEVSRRIESVDAEIIVRDRDFDLGSMSGGKLWEKEIPAIEAIALDGQPAVERVIPVFLGRMKLAGLTQNVFGINPQDFSTFAGARKVTSGQVFTDAAATQEAAAAFDALANGQEPGPTFFLPLMVDERLAAAGSLQVGDRVQFGDAPAVIVGIIETGVAGRVFAPINLLRGANGVAAPTAHMFFVKARGPVSTDQLYRLAEAIESKTKHSASLVSNYGQILTENYRNLTLFVSMVSVIALVICFLFILVTMYTMVLERGKEIAIMKSLGANRWMILKQTIQESLLLCGWGTALGIIMALGARWLIQTVQPLMTVEVRGSWLLGAAVVGIGGGVVSALYPGWIALRHDPVETLSFE